jgi:glycosyltransferase involved in cell wall biosynthesis
VSELHVVLPEAVDDAGRPSGGNTYDRRVIEGLAAGGWDVHRHLVPGSWPEPEPAARTALHTAIAGIPNDSVLLVDGLIGSAADQVLVPAARRLRLVLLVHMPLGAAPGPARERERAVVDCAAAVITTSSWTRDQLLDWYRARPDRLHVARPGVDRAALSPGTSAGGELLCVAAVSAHKGHDALVQALASVAELPWRCRFVGSLDRDPAFVAALRADVAALRLTERVEFAGPRVGAELEECYATADLVVLASRGETYGMVLAEALAHGVPVLTTDVGGVREALGTDGDRLAGLVVPPGDPPALAAAMRRWLTEPQLRDELRHRAVQRRDGLAGWGVTARELAAVLSRLAGGG